ncbi:hypothetical protein VSS74_31105 [Conexibacter stalactiti]|uniref:Peptidase inhibitor family I36 n=1 Tax=Conexibacter stalactiti TaxID=1940611 RepID=A0ABU4HZT3_9ACTN|nr:hypothetical protein [Conexibacter stalactiti]MDW5598848.1 hypothetical protein [Conexibacter stalactiti]MEC5039490.1 hypothetical protein [Conexibacter stalactiti]
MGRARNGMLVALALVVGLSLLSAAAAEAARRPTPKEAAAIKRLALDVCRSPAGACRYHGARVSTRNPRFAWADVTGEGFSGALLKRPRRGGTAFRVVGTQGGGIGSCAYWRRRAPRPVLRDLRVSGLLNVRTGATGRCG